MNLFGTYLLFFGLSTVIGVPLLSSFQVTQIKGSTWMDWVTHLGTSFGPAAGVFILISIIVWRMLKPLSKLVKEAEAKKQAADLDAQAEIARANGMAESKKIKADAQAYENQKIAQNLDVMKAQWDYEISKIRASKFNGVEVSNQSVYVPNTYDLRSGR